MLLVVNVMIKVITTYSSRALLDKQQLQLMRCEFAQKMYVKNRTGLIDRLPETIMQSFQFRYKLLQPIEVSFIFQREVLCGDLIIPASSLAISGQRMITDVVFIRLTGMKAGTSGQLLHVVVAVC